MESLAGFTKTSILAVEQIASDVTHVENLCLKKRSLHSG